MCCCGVSMLPMSSFVPISHSRHPIFANVGHIIKKEFVEQM